MRIDTRAFDLATARTIHEIAVGFVLLPIGPYFVMLLTTHPVGRSEDERTDTVLFTIEQAGLLIGGLVEAAEKTVNYLSTSGGKPFDA